MTIIPLERAPMIFLATAEQLNNANEFITHIGVGGIFALLVIKEVFEFIKNKKISLNGNGPVTKTEFAEHKKVAQYKDNCMQVQRTIEQKFNGLTDLTNERFRTVNKGIENLSELIKNGSK